MEVSTYSSWSGQGLVKTLLLLEIMTLDLISKEDGSYMYKIISYGQRDGLTYNGIIHQVLFLYN